MTFFGEAIELSEEWFDLSKYTVTIEFKEETGKWYLVVRRKLEKESDKQAKTT